MIISLQLDGGKQENSKIRKLFETKRAAQIRPKMVEKPKPTPKKAIKTNYCVNTKNIIPIFLDWLENNASKFRYRPYVNSITEDSVEVFFQGISPELIYAELYRHDEGYAGFRVAAKYKGVLYDWLLDFDIILMRDRNGYYCEFCSPREYFTDEASLVKQHLLDGVLRWFNENIDLAKGISFSDSEEGFYSATLVLTNANTYKTGLGKYISLTNQP